MNTACATSQDCWKTQSSEIYFEQHKKKMQKYEANVIFFKTSESLIIDLFFFFFTCLEKESAFLSSVIWDITSFEENQNNRVAFLSYQ